MAHCAVNARGNGQSSFLKVKDCVVKASNGIPLLFTLDTVSLAFMEPRRGVGSGDKALQKTTFTGNGLYRP
jgi:hypothetical protein